MGSGLEKLPRKMAAGHLFLLLFHQPVSGQDYQIGGDYQIQAAEDGYDYEYQNAIANANANERHRACPWNRPALGSLCSVPASVSCSYGSECCCGKCHPSFIARCYLANGRRSWGGSYSDACLRPSCGTDACSQPSGLVGPCKAAIPRWTFNKQRGCHRFTYGGCQGNANNFKTRAQCLNTCLTDDIGEGVQSQPLYWK